MTRCFRSIALFAVAAITGLVVCGCGSAATRAPATGTPATGTSVPGSTGPSGSGAATTRAPATTPRTPAAATPGTPARSTGLPTGYLPLYPFASLAEVRRWQAGYESEGHQPWHLSPDITATAFAAFLGYADVTQVAHRAVSSSDAHVAIGIKLPTVPTARLRSSTL
jgi:hypothetical protein